MRHGGGCGLTKKDRLVIRGEGNSSTMPHALRSESEPVTSSLLHRAAATLAAALSDTARATRDIAWQDGLDLLATIAGLKPLCRIGRGFAEPE